jgi:hypothetical protein
MAVGMSGRRAGSVAVAAVVVAALLLVALAAWASTSGPSGVLTDKGFDPAATPSAEPSVTASDDPAPSPFDPGGPEDVSTHAWVRVVALVLQVAVTLVAAYLLLRYVVLPLVRWLRGRLSLRRKERAAEAEADRFAVLEPPEAVAREMVADASAQRRLLLDTASPRNAVVACWHRFEAQAEAAGVGRHPWETSSEYTMRVLDLVDAHQPAVSRLAALYREARFSEHELTEQHRADALTALDEIHRTTGIPS